MPYLPYTDRCVVLKQTSMNYTKITIFSFLSILLTSCLVTNTAIESDISKNITRNLNMQKFQNNESLYPKGRYEKIQDFKMKKTSSDISFNKSQLKHILSSNYQLRNIEGKRIKKPFAVSNGNELFVNVKKLEKKLKEKTKISLSNTNNDFIRAYYVNENFAYFETEIISNYVLVAKFRRVGIMYNSSKNNFIVFDQREKIENFLEENFSDLKDEPIYITKKTPDLRDIRKLMLKVFEK